MVFTSLIAFVFPILLTIHVNKEYEEMGSIDVYLGFLKEKRAELVSLRVLLFSTLLAVVVAIIGNIV